MQLTDTFQFKLWIYFLQVIDSFGGNVVDLVAVDTRSAQQKLYGVVFKRYSVRILVGLPVVTA
jgi:hypothetical protein